MLQFSIFSAMEDCLNLPFETAWFFPCLQFSDETIKYTKSYLCLSWDTNFVQQPNSVGRAVHESTFTRSACGEPNDEGLSRWAVWGGEVSCHRRSPSPTDYADSAGQPNSVCLCAKPFRFQSLMSETTLCVQKHKYSHLWCLDLKQNLVGGCS